MSAQMPEVPRKAVFGLYGAGGFAREVMPLVRAHFAPARPGEEIRIVFVETAPTRSEVNGCPVVSEDEFFAMDCDVRFFTVAIAESTAREQIAGRCIDRGARATTIRSAHSIAYDHNVIGDGAIICAHSMITSNARIGKFFHSNIYSYVAHDCVIGDYVTFAPSVHCNGNVRIGNHVYVGTGAIIKPGSAERPLVIGDGAVIGMGAVVTRDVPPRTTVVGNPAKPHTRS